LAKVTFILGLYGSGKTYLSEKMKKQTGQTYSQTYLRTAAAYPPSFNS